MPHATAEQVILEILRQAGGEGLGKTKLFKAFYFAHVYFAGKRPERLTDWPIARLPRGPGIHDHHTLLHGLRDQGHLTIEAVPEGPYTEYRYRLTEKGRAATALAGEALDAARDAALYCKSRTEAELSELTHEHSRAWNGAADGDILDVTIDAIPDDEFDRREVRLGRLDSMLAGVMGKAGA